MALDGNAVFTAASGFIFTGDVGEDAPTPDEIYTFTGGTVLTGYTLIGHTSRDDLPEFGFDGGDTETRGSWQQQVLREVQTEVPVDYVTFNLIQLDDSTLELYYGKVNSQSDGSYGYREGAADTSNSSLLVVIVDGTRKIALWAPEVSLRREDAVAMEVDDFAVLPMRATFLSPESASEDKFRWIPGIEDEE